MSEPILPIDINVPPKQFEEKKKTIYTKSESIYALICLIFGYLFIKFVLLTGGNLLTTLYFSIFSVLALIYYKKKEYKIRKASFMWFILINIFSLNFIITNNDLIKFLDAIFIIFSITYFCYHICLKQNNNFITNHFILDMLEASLVLPFSHLGENPKAIIAISKKKKNNKIKMILLGLLLAIPITLIVGNLLISADSLFENMMSFAFNKVSNNTITFIFQFIFGIPIAFYLFGMLFSNGRKKDEINNINNQNTIIKEKSNTIPSIVVYTAITPICLLYFLFFISQAGYFLSAFESYLPDGFSYAEYARRGFFELFLISLINLFLIILINSLCKYKDNKKPKALKTYIIILCVFTLMLITTALSKMVLYINTYGLTLMRVYTSWFMILLAIIFLIILFSVFKKDINVIKPTVIAFIIMFFVLSFSNVDGLIAKYNVKWYQSGKLNEIDINMMYELSDNAIKYVLPLTKSSDSVIANESKEYIDRFIKNYNKNKLTDFNFSSYFAYKSVLNFK